MAAAFAFLGMLLVSLVVALLAAFQFGDFFGASNEFIWVISVVVAFGVIAMAVLAVAYALISRAAELNGIALLLAVTACAIVMVPGLIRWIASHSTNPSTVGIENTYIRIEIVVPALIAVLVQWGLVRRRWLRTTGEDDFTRWPWVTTAAAGLAILNPIGLAFVATTINRSAADFMWGFIAAVTGAAAAVLVVMALVECYIRSRMLRRRLEGARP